MQMSLIVDSNRTESSKFDQIQQLIEDLKSKKNRKVGTTENEENQNEIFSVNK